MIFFTVSLELRNSVDVIWHLCVLSVICVMVYCKYGNIAVISVLRQCYAFSDFDADL